MVTLHIGGKVVSWADAEKLFAENARTPPIEFRDSAGRVIATTAPANADDPDWVKVITPDETARRRAGPFLTLDDYRKQAGRDTMQ